MTKYRTYEQNINDPIVVNHCNKYALDIRTLRITDSDIEHIKRGEPVGYGWVDDPVNPNPIDKEALEILHKQMQEIMAAQNSRFMKRIANQGGL